MRLHRILLADDHAETLENIRAILGPHYEILETVSDGRALVEAALRLQPDLIITDITMPHLSGIRAASQINTHLPGVKLLFVTIHASPEYLEAALKAGGTGYILKSRLRVELLEALQNVLNGRLYISPGLSTEHLGRFTRPAR